MDHRLVDSGGAALCLPGVTSFALLLLWLTNQSAARAWIAWASSRGARAFRVLGMFANPVGIPTETGGILDPQAHQDYWTALRAMANEITAQGGVLLFTALADCQFAPLTTIDQQAFIDQAATTLDPVDHVLLSLANEAPYNGVDLSRLRRPVTRHPVAMGSMGGDAQPFSPPADVAEYETSREDDFPRHCKDLQDNYQGDNANPAANVAAHRFLNDACVLAVSEMIGIGDVAESGRTTADPFAVWQLAAGCQAFGSAYTIAHLRCGIPCVVPPAGSLTEQCLDAVVAACALPLQDFVFAPYVRGNADDTEPRLLLHHHDAGDGSGASRTYQLGPLVDGRYLVMVFQPEAGWSASWRTPVTVLSAFAWQGHPATVFVVRP